jgi:hypothetical protein
MNTMRKKDTRFLWLFPKRPQTFWDWFVVVLPLQLIHPFLWRIFELRLWAAPYNGMLLFTLLIQTIGGAFLLSLAFYFFFYQLVGGLNPESSESNAAKKQDQRPP